MPSRDRGGFRMRNAADGGLGQGLIVHLKGVAYQFHDEAAWVHPEQMSQAIAVTPNHHIRVSRNSDQGQSVLEQEPHGVIQVGLELLLEQEPHGVVQVGLEELLRKEGVTLDLHWAGVVKLHIVVLRPLRV
eukprot:CAMPEP_0174350428 /NCGR_PEP_ID=MMETSP0811_2-20130205/7515_1 /TAXON_ID=73025 ORGANISM="Eutreptiella gymnastica-like, Strain CCMP1594" /NCGR_SAMPLE_ID=MMETSP0811_2 /ASSEMBLY_ACC=CAM_ASM_000667 /LENGTH=130 /DNA_ID=CAMNT_0015478729 /DNA_START=95 /DNA_END=488 /DNA_ORIENTATION=-